MLAKKNNCGEDEEVTHASPYRIGVMVTYFYEIQVGLGGSQNNGV
jgi:hypothetical protein